MKTTLPLDMIGYILISISIIGLVLLAVLGKKNKLNKTAKNTVAVILAVVTIIGCFLSFGSKNQEAPVGENENANPGGFIGSDGEYHNYIPEFGDDVNNWMEENW